MTRSGLRRFAAITLRVIGAAGLLTLANGVLDPQPANAVVVEKIAAVVGDDAILFSDVRARATPLLRVIARQVPPGPQRTAAESQVYKDLILRMVEELLEVQAAERLKITVLPEEIDAAINNVAASQRMTPQQLFEAAAERSGMTELEYRAEIQRQLLEGKLLSQRVRGRIRITEEDLKNAFQRTLREERERREYRPLWIVLRLPQDATPEDTKKRDDLAASIYKQLKDGTSFAELAKAYSDDTKSAAKGGDLGIHAPIRTQAAQSGKRPALAEDIEAHIMPLEPGQFSEPFHFADAILIVGLQSRQPSRYTTLEAAKEEMTSRVQNEILARERTVWMDELKKRTYVDIRM
ncbi:MAG: peptidylprolyl isomerase [Polyangiaceae bacterium]